MRWCHPRRPRRPRRRPSLRRRSSSRFGDPAAATSTRASRIMSAGHGRAARSEKRRRRRLPLLRPPEAPRASRRRQRQRCRRARRFVPIAPGPSAGGRRIALSGVRLARNERSIRNGMAIARRAAIAPAGRRVGIVQIAIQRCARNILRVAPRVRSAASPTPIHHSPSSPRSKSSSRRATRSRAEGARLGPTAHR